MSPSAGQGGGGLAPTVGGDFGAPRGARAFGPGAAWSVFTRLFAIQGSWNYEVLMGIGIAFCLEPALRRPLGGEDDPRFRSALARECRYFNAHPYLASVAVGALARAELDGVPGDKIERFRTALCGPLGSAGDRLVWAGWLPVCSLLALAAYGLGARPLVVVAAFLVVYNAGHVALRAWGLRAGWTHGMRVATVLGAPAFRSGPAHLARIGALLAGLALPIALARIVGPGASGGRVVAVVVAAVGGAVVLARMHGRAEGWRIALLVLTVFVAYATVGPHG